MAAYQHLMDFFRNWQTAPLDLNELKKAKTTYGLLVSKVLERFSAANPSLLGMHAEACIFDFPGEQKIGFDAFFAPEGIRSNNAGFYLSLRSGESFIGCGYLENTFINGFAIYEEQLLHAEELEIMLHFLINYCGFRRLYGNIPEDVPGPSQMTNLGLDPEVLKPQFLIKAIPGHELTGDRLEPWLVQQYSLLLSYNQYLNRALDFYAHVEYNQIEDHVDLSKM